MPQPYSGQGALTICRPDVYYGQVAEKATKILVSKNNQFVSDKDILNYARQPPTPPVNFFFLSYTSLTPRYQ